MPLLVKRYVGEAIQIGDNVTVRLLALGESHVVLEVHAPSEVHVHRHEKDPVLTMRKYTVSDGYDNETTVEGLSPVDAMMAFTKEWPFYIKEV